MFDFFLQCQDLLYQVLDFDQNEYLEVKLFSQSPDIRHWKFLVSFSPPPRLFKEVLGFIHEDHRMVFSQFLVGFEISHMRASGFTGNSEHMRYGIWQEVKGQVATTHITIFCQTIKCFL